MRIYTAHLHPRRAPVLVREGFSWGGLFLGPLWLLWRRAWVGGVAALVALALLCTLLPPPLRPPLAFLLFLLAGMFGNDLRRWSLGGRGFRLVHVVAARNRDAAFLRLLDNRPDLGEVAA